MRSGRPWVATAVAAALLAAGAAVLAARNLSYPGMWWDEAAQFWVSQGLSNYSPPFAERRGLLEVGRVNRRENLDPGGFSVLLHLWTVGGRGLERLRALPFAFFLVGTAALALLGWRLTRSVPFALAAGSVLWLYPAARYFAFEVRAYSMEMAGVAAAALGLAHVVERPSARRALLLGLVLAGSLTSRYSAVLAALACGCALLVGVARRYGWRTAARCLLAAWLPVAVAGALIVWATLRHQLWGEMRGGALGVSTPAYTRGSAPGHGGDALVLLDRNLLSPAAAPITVCVLFAALARRRLWRSPAGAAPCQGDLPATLAALHTYVAGVLVLSAAVGLAGVYPWDIASRWSVYLVALSALAVLVLAAEAVALVRAVAAPPAAVAWRRLRFVGVAAALAVVAAAAGLAAGHRQAAEATFQVDLQRQLEALPAASLADASVLVGFYQVPVVRYLYEHGPLAGRPEYPRAFRFENAAQWRLRRPIAAAPGDLAFVVTAQSPGELQPRLPGATLRVHGPASGHLLRVVWPDGSADGWTRR